MPAESPAPPAPRLPVIDALRGVAVIAMIVYHLMWDLSFLGFIAEKTRFAPGWLLFARGIAASFLLLSGIGLVLAHGREWRPRAFFKRLGLVAGAAALVTLATYLAMPDRFVFFGILHAIAAGSLLALPFLRLPAAVAALAALAILALPSLVSLPAFDMPALVWLGLGTRVPLSNDFVPLFPWAGFVLTGVALAKAAPLARLPGAGLSLIRSLARIGRHSLLIYLLHQPILFGGLSLAARMRAPATPAVTQDFGGACRSQCAGSGNDAALCTRLCSCVEEGLKTEGLWRAVLANDPTPGLRDRVGAISRRCTELTPR